MPVRPYCKCRLRDRAKCWEFKKVKRWEEGCFVVMHQRNQVGMDLYSIVVEFDVRSLLGQNFDVNIISRASCGASHAT